MLRVALVVALGWAAAWGAEEWTWPPVTYKGKERSPEWCQKQYDYFCEKMTRVEDEWVNLSEVIPPETKNWTAIGVGRCISARGSVDQVLGDDEFILKTGGVYTKGPKGPLGSAPFYWHVKGIETKGMGDKASWAGTLALVGMFKQPSGSMIFSCRLLPKSRHNLTKEEFLDALKGDAPLGRFVPANPSKRQPARWEQVE